MRAAASRIPHRSVPERSRGAFAGLLYAALGVTGTARAAELTADPIPPQPIWGGTQTEECAWPTTVFLEGCSGTLVHPEVVVFASHCLYFAGQVAPGFATFGEQSEAPAREVPIEQCTMFPSWEPTEENFGNDVAFCHLAEPVLDLPIVPILMGCEAEVLGPGQAVTLVGFGVTDDDTFGVKHEVVTTINGLEGTEINLGGGGMSSCNGDSGGPAFLQLDDGSWRVFGVTSRGVSASCADESIYGTIHPHVPWIERSLGIDITPCHDADGTWNPSDDCTDFPLEPGVATSGWNAGCGQGRVGGASATCGPPFDDGGATGSTGEVDTGLDDSGGRDDSGTSGLPGGTGDTDDGQGDGTVADTDAVGATDDDRDACACRTRAPRPAARWLLPALAVLLRPRRRRTS